MLNAASDAREFAVHGRGVRLRRLRLRLGFGLAEDTLLGLILLLHVDAALEVRAIGDRHARGDDVTLDRSGLLDVDLLGGLRIIEHKTEDNDSLGGDRRLDAAVRADREDVVAQLDLAVDTPFDRQILAAAQLTIDDNGLPNARLLLVHRLCLLLRLISTRRRR